MEKALPQFFSTLGKEYIEEFADVGGHDVVKSLYIAGHSPDIYNYKLNPTDKFLIIGCDGLWDVFTNQQAANFVLQNMNKFNLQSNRLAKLLANQAIKKGSTDNISVIIVFF